MKKAVFFCGMLLISMYAVRAQTPADSVKATIDKMFLAMKNSNAEMLKECFADSAIMQTIIRDRNGNTAIRNETVEAFAGSMNKLPKNAADERIVYDVVKTDGALAIAWTPYKFYYNGQFSHCGVNSFQLVRLNGNWKIQYIIDTRRKDKCE